MKFASSPTWVLIPCLLVAACDGGKKAEPVAKQDDTKASDADLDKRLAERKAKREADEKAKAAADEAKAKSIEAVCVLPPGKKPEKSLDKACAAVGPAYDRFMKRFYEGETLAKWESAKGTQLPMVIAQCTKTASVEVGACIVHALDSAPAELEGEQSAIIRGCIDKFGPGSAHGATAAAGGAVPKKPR